MIEIYAVSYNGQPSAASMRGAFGPEGGTVGRSPDNRLALADPARHVSRIQAKVRWDGRRYWIANTSEANPLFLNDEEIESGKERPLVAGDELRVGLYVLRVREPVGPTVDYRPAGGSAGTEQTLGAGAAPRPGSPPAAASIDGLLGHAGAAANPFADLLGSSSPLASAPAARMDPLGALSGNASLAGAGRAGSADPLAGLGQPARPAAVPPPHRPSAGADPFAGLIAATPAAPMPAAPAGSSHPLAALARPSADPFADLLGASGSSVGGAPMPARPAGPAATHIPDDFNPFAMPATPARNTADPLRDLADDGIDLASLSGEKRVSLVDFDPSAKIDPRDTLRGGTPSLVDSQHAADPMKLFGGPEDRLVAGNAAAPAGRTPMRDDFAELGANFTPPRALADPRAPGAGQVPAPAAAGAGRAPPSVPAAERVAPIAPEVRPPAPPARAASLPASGSIDLAGLAASAPASPIPAYPLPGAPVPAMGGPARPALGGGGGGGSLSSAAPGDLLAAFLEGAHAQAMNLPNGLTPELMRTMGRLVYHAVAGAMTLISARQITKREMGAEVTMIVPKGNNPLKFLPTPEAALMQILGPKMPGFMSSVDAMEDAFDDLRAHEVGVIAGTRAALGEVLRRFDPKVLEARLGTGGLIDNLVPATRRSKLWAAFEAQFNEVHREAEEDFNKLFGEAFIVAYQAEVARHRSPPR